MKQRRLAALAIAAMACWVAVPAQASAPTARIGDYFFGPGKLTIKRGTRVTWRWVSHNGTPHDVTVKSGPVHFTSHEKTAGSYSFVFRRAGTYHLICKIHPFMKETVVVR